MIIITLIIITYAALMFLFSIVNLRPEEKAIQLDDFPKVSLIVPFRDEKKNLVRLINSIENQTYPKEKIQVLFVNDHSTDGGEELINQFKPRIELLFLEKTTGKKAALDYGIKSANAKIILVTDADTELPAKWVETLVTRLEFSQLDLLIAPVNLRQKKWIDKLLTIELQALVSSAIASIRLGQAFLANGANLAFRKSLYLKTAEKRKDFSLASGDDVFLLHAAKEINAKVGAITVSDSIVKTSFDFSWKRFIHQRIRWLQKGKAYRNAWSIFLSFLVFLTNLSIAITCIGICSRGLDLAYGSLIIMKWFADVFLLFSLGQTKASLGNLLWTIILTVIYPIYMIVIALLSLIIRPQWKGRTI